MRVRDLDGGHLRLHFAVFRHEKPTLLVNAAIGIPRDASLIDGGDQAAVRQAADPFGFEQQGKRRLQRRRDFDALKDSAMCAPVFDIVFARGFLRSRRLRTGSNGRLLGCHSLSQEESKKDRQRG